MSEGEGVSDDEVRALMRAGLSDEAIARRTGLSPMRLLELRAAAAVEERVRPQAPRSGENDR